jgi:hypothetical protein
MENFRLTADCRTGEGHPAGRVGAEPEDGLVGRAATAGFTHAAKVNARLSATLRSSATDWLLPLKVRKPFRSPSVKVQAGEPMVKASVTPYWSSARESWANRK